MTTEQKLQRVCFLATKLTDYTQELADEWTRRNSPSCQVGNPFTSRFLTKEIARHGFESVPFVYDAECGWLEVSWLDRACE